MSNNNNHMNILDDLNFTQTIACLNVCLQERTKIQVKLENKKNNKDLKGKLIEVNMFCSRHLDTLRFLFEKEEDELKELINELEI